MLFDDEIHITDDETGITIVFSYEYYKYRQRKYKDGTGPIKSGLRLTSKTGTKRNEAVYDKKSIRNSQKTLLRNRSKQNFKFTLFLSELMWNG